VKTYAQQQVRDADGCLQQTDLLLLKIWVLASYSIPVLVF